MIDVPVLEDKNISLKEFQKLSKYKDLEIEVSKMWKLPVKNVKNVENVEKVKCEKCENFQL